MKQKTCERAEKVVDAAKRRGPMALYKVAKVTGMRKKLASIKDKVDRVQSGDYIKNGKDTEFQPF